MTATDIGTGKVVVVVAERPRPGSHLPVRIVGMGRAATDGLRKGLFVDGEKVTEALNIAKGEAEKSAGISKIESTAVSVSREVGLKEQRISELLSVSGRDFCVSKRDVSELTERIGVRKIPDAGYEEIVRFLQPFFLGDEALDDPIGHVGQILKTSRWVVAGKAEKLIQIRQVFSAVGFRVEKFFTTSQAVGSFHANPEARQNGVLVMDIGAGVTDSILYWNGHVVGTNILPVGGDHIDVDLCEALELKNHAEARALKERHNPAVLVKNQNALALASADDAKGVSVSPCARQISVFSVEQVIRARLTDIFSLVRQRFAHTANPERLRAGIILTGGAAHLHGIEDIAYSIFRTPVTAATFPEWAKDPLADFQYSVALGILGNLYNAAVAVPVSQRKGFFSRFF